MKLNEIRKRFATIALSMCVVASTAIPALAASVDDATIHMDTPCSLTIYKYDLTNAEKDGVWSTNSYISTGRYDQNINDILGDAIRGGDDDNISNLENGDTSKGYAIKGVEFSYLKVADIYQFTESANDNSSSSHIEVLYKFDKTFSADLLSAIGLENGKNSYANANALDKSAWFYQSDVLNEAIANAQNTNATTLKNALENYLANNAGTAMPLTDESGYTRATNLPVGLYLLTETKVPEMVTSTTAPFFVSLPTTSVNGGGDDQNGNDAHFTDGGKEWLYDLTIYPKNETGIVTLEKTVRESQQDTGVHGGTTNDITDGYMHYATASTNDKVEYQIISTLPTITSKATALSDYTFVDVLSRGLRYDDNTPVLVEWFTDKSCTDKVCEWTENDGKFIYERTANADGSHTMKISMTADGLNEINTANTSANNINGALYAGYSNYTIRITYGAILNPDESIIYGDAGNPNEVVLTWKRTSSDYYDTLIDDCHVFTYGVNLTKKFSDGKDAQDLFDAVTFKMQNKTDGYYVQAKLNEAEGIWYVTGHTTNEADATRLHPVDWNGQKGQVVIKGIEDDNYVMTEIETADGYVLLKHDINIDIFANDDPSRPCATYDAQEVLGVIQNDPRYAFDGGLDLHLANIPQTTLAHNMLTASANVDGNAVIMLNDESDTHSTNALAPLNVTNSHGFDFPGSGSLAMLIITITGVVLLTASGFIFYKIRKDKKTA